MYIRLKSALRHDTQNIRFFLLDIKSFDVSYLILFFIIFFYSTGAFALAWSPYAMHCVVSMLGLTKGMSPFVATIPALIAKSSVIYHPLIYVCKNRPLKSVIFKTFLCRYTRKRCSRGAFVSLPLKEVNGSNKKGNKSTMTITMDEDADFSQLAFSNTLQHCCEISERKKSASSL